MAPRDAAFFSASILLASTWPADACVPLRFDTEGLSAASVAESLVADSTRVELMRVTSRREVKADPIYAEYFDQVYEFRLETIEAVDGRRGPPLTLHGFDPDWLIRRLPDFPHIGHEPLWWLTPRGYEELQDTRLLDPADQGSIACAAPMTFAVGADYLVFRDGSGALLAPAFGSHVRPSRPLQRPVIERVYEPDDPWLNEVRRAVEANPQPPPSPWIHLFEAIFGERRGAVEEGDRSRD